MVAERTWIVTVAAHATTRTSFVAETYVSAAPVGVVLRLLMVLSTRSRQGYRQGSSAMLLLRVQVPR